MFVKHVDGALLIMLTHIEFDVTLDNNITFNIYEVGIFTSQYRTDFYKKIR